MQAKKKVIKPVNSKKKNEKLLPSVYKSEKNPTNSFLLQVNNEIGVKMEELFFFLKKFPPLF